uniref:Variant surface glycoprotein 1125.4094 n=1 Tax=Trypanosoma brucei TaxID=5691 RepID=A0A1J0RA85_9TRYP|nr:variant surface glycoprotein 1125.4094 [Trypanosoma brucei]
MKICSITQALLALLICGTRYGCSSIQPSAKQAKTACEAAHQLGNLSNQATAAITQATAKIKQMLLKAQKLDVAAAHPDTKLATAAAAIASQFKKQVAAAATLLEQNSRTIYAGAAALNRLSGNQATIAALERLSIKDLNINTAATLTTTSTLGQIPPQVAASTTQECHDAQGQPTRDDTGVEHDSALSYPLTLHIAAAADTPRTLGSAFSICGKTDGSTNNQPPSSTTCTSGEATNVGIKGGKPIKTTPATTSIEGEASAKKYREVSADNKIPNKATLNKELALVKLMIEAANTLEQQIVIPSIADAYNSINPAMVLAKTLGGEDASPSDENIKQQVKAAAEVLFGADGDKIKSKLEEHMKAFQPSKAAGSDGNKKLDSIDDPNKLSKAAAYYTIKKFIDEAEEKKKNQASPSCPTKTEKASEPAKTSDECKKHTTSEDCKKENGCDFDDKKDPKCFPKVDTEKKGEKSFSSNLRVFVPQVFAALIWYRFRILRISVSFYKIYEIRYIFLYFNIFLL